MANKYVHFQHDDHYHYDLQGYGRLIPDIIYDHLSEKNKLDLYIPSIAREAYPVIIYVHGSPFMQGDKTHHISAMLNGLMRGYAVAAINYRLNDEAPYPAFLRDLCEGIRYLKARADDYHLNKELFFLWGDTHGGYLSCLIAAHGKDMHFKTHYPDEDLSVAGVISESAPLDLADFYDLNKNRHGLYSNGFHDEITFQKKDQELINFLKTINPIDFIDGTEPPMYLFHGLKDKKIPLSYTERMADALARHHDQFVVSFIKEGEHPIDFYDQHQYVEPIMKFIDAIVDTYQA